MTCRPDDGILGDLVLVNQRVQLSSQHAEAVAVVAVVEEEAIPEEEDDAKTMKAHLSWPLPAITLCPSTWRIGSAISSPW